MIMKWMEVYIVARTGRPKSDNPKKTLIGLKLTEEEAARLKGYNRAVCYGWVWTVPDSTKAAGEENPHSCRLLRKQRHPL